VSLSNERDGGCIGSVKEKVSVSEKPRDAVKVSEVTGGLEATSAQEVGVDAKEKVK
jgi:hypothetical protein